MSELVYVGRLAGARVLDPQGGSVGKVRDVVLLLAPRPEQPPRAVGLVVEVPGRRKVFMPMTRVMAVDGGQVLSTGLLNMRQFEQRTAERLALAELLDRHVTVADGGADATIDDVAIERGRTRDWFATRLSILVSDGPRGRGPLGVLRRRGHTQQVAWQDVLHAETEAAQGAAQLVQMHEGTKAADLADVLHNMPPKRRKEVADELDDDRLADVLEELPIEDQVELVAHLSVDRAADVLEAMGPDDAADLLGVLPEQQAEELLTVMEPDEAKDVRELLRYDADTAGGLMTTEPVILPPETAIAEALAHVRREELAPALAAAVFVVRPPLEPPTGRYLGLVHLQSMLRHPPHEAIGTLLDKEVPPVRADEHISAVTTVLATYNLVSVPVTDDAGRLLGVVTVDDVLDHMLPDDWRQRSLGGGE